MKKLQVLTLCMFIFPSIGNASYLCTTDQAAGILYDKFTQKWVSSKLKGGKKYILRKSSENDARHYAIKEKFDWLVLDEIVDERNTLNDHPVALCKDGFDLENDISCSLLSDDFNMNRQSLRFIVRYNGTYVPTNKMDKEWVNEGMNENIIIEVGKCKKI